MGIILIIHTIKIEAADRVHDQEVTNTVLIGSKDRVTTATRNSPAIIGKEITGLATTDMITGLTIITAKTIEETTIIHRRKTITQNINQSLF